jgi:hypothetical protein
MDDARFDELMRVLSTGASRRAVLGLVAGGAGLASIAAIDTVAKKKRKKNKHAKKPKRCLTVGNRSLACPKGSVCCDPGKSTAAGCAPAGFPVCCESDGFAHESDIVCCADRTQGDEGICDTEYPHCCQESIGGCCEDGYPLCCSNALGEYCCPPETTCCESNPTTGCCDEAAVAREATADGARSGVWKPRLAESVRAGADPDRKTTDSRSG